MLLTSRRAFLGGLISALAAPAIVHATNIMPVRNFLILPEPTFESFDKLMPEGMQYQWVSVPSGYAVDPVAKLGDSITLVDGRSTAWFPVPASRFKSQFAIAGETIKIGDCVLVERKKSMCVTARNQEITAANRMVTDWADRCMANGFEGGVRYSQPTTVDFQPYDRLKYRPPYLETIT